MNKEEQATKQFLSMLKDPKTIRLQAHKILDLAKKNQLEHFALDPEKKTTTASFIVDFMIKKYPDLNIPYHSRLPQF